MGFYSGRGSEKSVRDASKSVRCRKYYGFERSPLLLFFNIVCFDAYQHKIALSDRILKYLLAGYLPVLFMAYVGINACAEWWLFEGDANDRIHGDNLGFAGLHFRPLSIVIAAYQIYSTLVSMCFQDYRKIEAFVHHISTATLAFLALQPYANYYGFFFFGFTELTNRECILQWFIYNFHTSELLKDHRLIPMLVFRLNFTAAISTALLCRFLPYLSWPRQHFSIH